MSTKSLPLVCVGVINYNGIYHLSYCLPSVLQLTYPALHICVVDNASTDGSVAYVRKEFPTIEVIQNKRNMGYTGAANLIIRQAKEVGASYVLILTNDILLDRRAVSCAVAVAETDFRIAVIGFRLFGKHSYESPDTFKRESALWSELEYSEDTDIDGAAMFVRMKVFDLLGNFDERYFMYADESDFEWRVMQAGYRMVRLNVPVWHNAGMSRSKVPWRISWLSTRNGIRFYVKHYGWIRGLAAIKTLLNHACNPFLPPEVMSHRTVQRARPSNVIINGLFVVGALLWNVIHARETYLRRRYEYLLVEHARKQLCSSQSVDEAIGDLH